jgi:ribosomal protein S18 acetylase RimI-like enzyme
MDWVWFCRALRSTHWGAWLNDTQIMVAVDHSIVFGLYLNHGRVALPVGFARVVTDRAIFSHITDVYVDTEHRNNGYGSALMRAVLAHPDIGRTICILATRDAQGFYGKFGFAAVTESVMKRSPNR